MKKYYIQSRGRGILHPTKRRKDNWVGHILRSNSRLKDVIEEKIEGEIEVTERQRRRSKQPLGEFK